MAIRRRPRHFPSPSDVPPIVRLWLLRLLVPLGGHREFMNQHGGFGNEVLAEILGLANWLDPGLKEFKLTAVRSDLRKLHQAAEHKFDLLSRHSDCLVREAIAVKANLPIAAVRRLAGDSAISVARGLLRSNESCARLTNDEVLTLCQRDPDLAGMVACSYEYFVLDDDAVINYQEIHPDTQVRENLAGNPFVPKPVLRRIAQGDPDGHVREPARQVML